MNVLCRYISYFEIIFISLLMPINRQFVIIYSYNNEKINYYYNNIIKNIINNFE